MFDVIVLQNQQFEIRCLMLWSYCSFTTLIHRIDLFVQQNSWCVKSVRCYSNAALWCSISIWDKLVFLVRAIIKGAQYTHCCSELDLYVQSTLSECNMVRPTLCAHKSFLNHPVCYKLIFIHIQPISLPSLYDGANLTGGVSAKFPSLTWDNGLSQSKQTPPLQRGTQLISDK